VKEAKQGTETLVC